MLARQNSVSVNISRNNGRARDCVILEGRGRTEDWYILRNCWDYERGVSFLGNVLGARRKKVRPVCSTISGELRAAMSPGYVPWYTERSLSRRCISRDAARPGHLTYKMVSVFQLSRDKLWIMGVNTKQPVDCNAPFLQRSQERYCLLLRHPRHSLLSFCEAKCRMLSTTSSKAGTKNLHIFT